LVLIPEPARADLTWASRRESIYSWIARSTRPRAVAARRFLNGHLSALPPQWQDRMHHALTSRWDSAFFELILARMLQQLGATLEIEIPQADGRRPDFLARFQSGVVAVEATVPIVNAAVGKLAARRAPLLDLIEKNAPPGWTIIVFELPEIGPSGSQQAFRNIVGELRAIPAPAVGQEAIEVDRSFEFGRLHLHLWPHDPRGQSIGVEPPMTILDDTESRIRHAYRYKAPQVRKAAYPALLAVNVCGISSDEEDFDLALMGRSVAVMNRASQVVATRFDLTGALTARMNDERPPAFAGVLAFRGLRITGGPEPILYLHPRFRGELPKELLDLQQRRLDPATMALITVPRKRAVLEALGFRSVADAVQAEDDI
jgi:hypothetical protein